MKTRFLWAVWALVLLAGCQKDGGVGSSIRFSAVARSASDAGTRVTYSDVQDASGYERIDWTANDRIAVAMEHDDNDSFEQQVYSITGISPNARYSEAGMAPYNTGAGLQWGTGDHHFWAGYPSSVTVGDHTLAGTISASQTQNYVTTNDGVVMFENEQPLFLFASLLVPASEAGENPISLDFFPMVTTFDFEVGSNTTSDMLIRSIEMTTEPAEEDVPAALRALTGPFTASYSVPSGSSDAYLSKTVTQASADANNSSISVTFSPQPVASQNRKMRFRVLALPQDIQGLSVVFHTTETVGGSERDMKHTLRLKQNGGSGREWIRFPGCHKANISGILIPGAEWLIKFSGPRVQQWTVYDEVIIGVE